MTAVHCIIFKSFFLRHKQSKIENFIQSGLRNPILVGHRQAWSWQDEWYGLTIDDIRQLEKQTQRELSQRMANESGALDGAENDNACKDDASSSSSIITRTPSPNTATTGAVRHRDVGGEDVTNSHKNDTLGNPSQSSEHNFNEDSDSNRQTEIVAGTTTSNHDNNTPLSDVTSTTTTGNTTTTTPSSSLRNSHHHRNSSIQTITNQERLLEINMKHIEQLESSDDADEYEADDLSLYYDALGKSVF